MPVVVASTIRINRTQGALAYPNLSAYQALTQVKDVTAANAYIYFTNQVRRTELRKMNTDENITVTIVVPVSALPAI